MQGGRLSVYDAAAVERMLMLRVVIRRERERAQVESSLRTLAPLPLLAKHIILAGESSMQAQPPQSAEEVETQIDSGQFVPSSHLQMHTDAVYFQLPTSIGTSQVAVL